MNHIDVLTALLGADGVAALRELIRDEVQDAMQGTLTNLDAPDLMTSPLEMLAHYLTSPLQSDEPLDPEALANYDPFSEFDETCADRFSDQEERIEGED